MVPIFVVIKRWPATTTPVKMTDLQFLVFAIVAEFWSAEYWLMERSVDGKFEGSVPRKKNRPVRIKLLERNYRIFYTDTETPTCHRIFIGRICIGGTINRWKICDRSVSEMISDFLYLEFRRNRRNSTVGTRMNETLDWWEIWNRSPVGKIKNKSQRLENRSRNEN